MGITEEDIWTATYDALPLDYQSHIDSQYEVDFRDMDDIDFDTELNAIEIDGIQGIAAIVLEKIGHLRQSV